MSDQPITSFDGIYRFLSNFHPVMVKLDGETYPSTEHAYQAAKSLDPAYRAGFLTCTATEAKRRGRRAVLRADWEQVKIGVMLDLLRQKFAHETELAALLDQTGDRELIEGNWWGDTFWGVCRGKGQNHLGKLLMQVRAEGRLL